MSKPLIFFLQFIGLVVFLIGAGNGSASGIIIGLALVVFPGIKLRERFKND